MGISDLSIEDQKHLERILGYLNFSSGAADVRFLGSLNHLFELASGGGDARPPWRVAVEVLQAKLQELQRQSAAFSDAGQALAILDLLPTQVLPGYLEFHRDLLFHQTEESLFNSLFVGRAVEAVLRQGGPWSEVERIRRGAISQLNDYLGYRPVATLEGKKTDPYEHEWVRPVPLYIRDVGTAVGPYRQVVELTISLLRQTDQEILRDAYFNPELLDELAFDPRAYDFDHPVNKRPNYHFGQWDPHHRDQRGGYRRYVAQQVTLNALMKRLDAPAGLPREELLFEAAAVLAGTMIMATGVSGAAPDSHDSSVSLSNLLPKIAAYRDAFYERLLEGLRGPQGDRLRAEAAIRRQPFGGARQHLNAELARRRASQLEHVHLAAVFARMGYADTAAQHANVVPAASARMLCHIDCRLSESDQAISAGNLEHAASLLEDVMDWVLRGIDCGAVIDPWNILGFDANFSLFPAMENTVRDHRADELVHLMEQVFAVYSRIWSEAAAKDQQELCRRVADQFRTATDWWRKYAAHEVSSVEAIDAADAFRAAELVAKALHLWHQGGAAAEDVRFWAPHADLFDSPKAYSLVVRALLEREDFVSSMALLMHWLSRAEELGLEKGDTSFAELAERWMLQLRRRTRQDATHERAAAASGLACKFLDFLEANAEDYWQPPRFELHGTTRSRGRDEPLDQDDEEEDEEQDTDRELFDAAYEDVVYIDSTDDGVDSEVFEGGQASDDELLAEAKRLRERLSILSTVARLWQLALSLLRDAQPQEPGRLDVLRRWTRQAADNRERLQELVDQVDSFRLPTPTGDQDSLVEYDRVRSIKESILEQVIATSVDTIDALRLLSADACAIAPEFVRESGGLGYGEAEGPVLAVLSAILRGDPQAARRRWGRLIEALLGLPLLYVPLAKGGNPHDIVAAKSTQRTIQDLLAWLPRRGLMVETCQLIETAREMERLNPVGPGAVTEFDELFKIGYKALVKLIADSASDWPAKRPASASAPEGRQAALVDCLKQWTESLLLSWLTHSKTLRLSVLEKVRDKRAWAALVAFVETYGADLFTQRFLNLANLRAILHQGVGRWLEQLQDEIREQLDWRLLEDLESGRLSRSEAVEQLTLILDAIVENYGEYRDYNSMTTQSDRGELLYMLLDFLRLRTQYDRICWQLKPVVWAHEILVRRDFQEAARLWRREFAEQTSQQASIFLDKLTKLQGQYAMRMPTVADRLGERFVRPMAIDRIRALVRPAIEELRRGGVCASFLLFEEEIEQLTREPSGVGLDVPAWLMALEEEVEAASQPAWENDPSAELDAMIPQKKLSFEDIQRQLEKWASKR